MQLDKLNCMADLYIGKDGSSISFQWIRSSPLKSRQPHYVGKSLLFVICTLLGVKGKSVNTHSEKLQRHNKM